MFPLPPWAHTRPPYERFLTSISEVRLRLGNDHPPPLPRPAPSSRLPELGGCVRSSQVPLPSRHKDGQPRDALRWGRGAAQKPRLKAWDHRTPLLLRTRPPKRGPPKAAPEDTFRGRVADRKAGAVRGTPSARESRRPGSSLFRRPPGGVTPAREPGARTSAAPRTYPRLPGSRRPASGTPCRLRPRTPSAESG